MRDALGSLSVDPANLDIFPLLPLSEIFIAIAAVFLSSLISGLGGFGGGFVYVIAMTPIVGPKAVIPMLSIYALFSNISRVVIYRKGIDWQLTLQFTLASLPGVWAGTTFFAVVPERVLLLVLGFSLIAIIPLRRYLRRIAFRPGLRTVIGLGFVFGVVSGTAVGSGMLVVAGLSSIGLQGPVLLGTDAAIGLINSGVRAFSFTQLDLLPLQLVMLGGVTGVGAFPGTWLASRLVHRLGLKRHDILIEVLIICGGSYFLFKGLV